MILDNNTLALIAVSLLFYWTARPHLRVRHLRGNRLTALLAVWWRLRRWERDPNAFQWGRRLLSGSLACQNCLVAGTVGSGKTILVRLLLQREIGRRDRSRFLLYDGKGDLIDVVAGMPGAGNRIRTFDPFLKDGARWNIARDVTDFAAANQVARILFPKGKHEHQPFFSEAVQNLASAIMMVFVELQITDWRLSHLIYILRSAERIQQVLRLTPRGRETIANFVNTGETWANVMATLSNRLQDYEIVAALWDHASTEYSLKEWAQEATILLLRKNQACTDVVDALNRVLFALGKRYLLSKPADTRERSWVVLDELASFADVKTELALLLEQGRSRNIACVLGFQNLSALRDEYGEHGADRLVALCSTKALLRFEDQTSAEWAAGFFGQEEVQVRSVSSSYGEGGASTTTSYDIKDRALVLPSEFQATPRTGRAHGLSGYFVAPIGNPPLAYRDQLPAAWLFNGQTLAPDPTIDRPTRPDDQQRLQTTPADLERLLGRRLDAAGTVPTEEGRGQTPGATPTPTRPAPIRTPARRSAPTTASRPRPVRGETREREPSGPVEVWDLTTGTIEPTPSIWQVNRPVQGGNG